MKKLIILLVITTAISGYDDDQGYVIAGQLWGSALHNYPEKLKGKVKEVRWENFWGKVMNGKIIEGERRDPKAQPPFVENYNSSGTVLSFAWLNNEGGINKDFWSIRVEAEGKLIKKAMYYIQDTLRAYTRNVYSENNLAEVGFLNPGNDSLIARVVYTYDQNRNRIKWQEFSSAGIPSQYVEFIYDKGGSVEQMKQFSALGKLTYSEEFIYNEKGVWIGSHTENYVRGTKGTNENSYEYDKKGNWIKRISFQPDKTIKLIVRKITYY